MTEEQKERMAQQLYDRAAQELNDYITELKTQTPDQIIGRCYEVSVKQDMVLLLEEHDFPPQELEVLALLEHPLEIIYQDWLQRDDSHMNDLANTFEDYAVQRLREKAELHFSDPKVQRYALSHQDARAAGEICMYYANRDRDLRCLHAFEKGISDANANRTMRPFVQKWTEDYGHDRCKFVLGYSVQRADWDKRYSPKARQDAEKYDYHITKDHDPHGYLCTNAHPCLVNGAYELLMEQERGKQKQAPQKNEPER